MPKRRAATVSRCAWIWERRDASSRRRRCIVRTWLFCALLTEAAAGHLHDAQLAVTAHSAGSAGMAGSGSTPYVPFITHTVSRHTD